MVAPYAYTSQSKLILFSKCSSKSSASHRVYTPLKLISLSDYLGNQDTNQSVQKIINSLAECTAIISKKIAVATIEGLTGKFGETNFSGDEQKKLDVISNDLIKKALIKTKCASILATEEEDDAIVIEDALDDLIVTFDPLDGSSNIDCAVPTGTIFAIYKNTKKSSDPLQNVLQSGDAIIASGYCMYSSSTLFVMSTGKGTQIFTFDPKTNTYYLTERNLKCPTRGPYYSLNEGRSPDWPEGLTTYINDIKNGKGTWGKKYSSRYICSMVADLHRTLLYGGWAGNPRSHLRLLYEAAPLSYLTEQAGGAGSDGINRYV